VGRGKGVGPREGRWAGGERRGREGGGLRGFGPKGRG
jgi:hypothetical protein